MTGLLTFHNRFVRGYDPTVGPVAGGTWYEGTTAFLERFGTPALAVCYEPYTVDGVHVRLRKAAIKSGAVRADQIQCLWIAIDVDRHGPGGEKEPWDVNMPAEVDTALEGMRALPAPYSSFLYWHSTENGYRAWYLLDRPVSAAEFEPLAESLRAGLLERGVEADDQCRDWTRLFALPRIVKDNGVDTANQWWFREAWQADANGNALTLQVGSLSVIPTSAPMPSPTAGPSPTTTAVVGFSVDVDDAIGLVYHHGDIDEPTDAGKILRRAVESNLMRAGNHTIAAEAVLDGVSFPQGMRDVSVAQTAGWMVARARSVMDQGITVDHVLGLMAPACLATDEDTGPQEDGRSWVDKAATKILEFWRSDQEQVDRQRVEALSEALDEVTLESLVRDLHTKTGDDLLLEEFNPAWVDHLRTYTFLSAANPNRIYVLQPGGHYVGPVYDWHQAIGLSARSPVGVVQGATWIDDEGKTKYVSVSRAKMVMTTQVGRTRQEFHSLELPANHKTDIEREAEGALCLVERKHRPMPVRSFYSARVDEYLRQLTGCKRDKLNENYRQLLYWLTYLRDFDNSQLPMLFLYGASRAGKSLLGNAISQQAPTYRPSSAGGDFNAHYAKGTILIYDDLEPISYGNWTQLKKALGEFLNVLSGQEIEVNEKFGAMSTVRLPWRLVVLNNSPQFFHDLMDAHSRSADRDKRDALARRTLLIEVDQQCRQWILDNIKYGEDFASEVAAHIGWLNENREHYAEWFAELDALKEPSGMRFVSAESAFVVADESQNWGEVEVLAELVKVVRAALRPEANSYDIVLHLDGTVLVKRGQMRNKMGLERGSTGYERKLIDDALSAVLKPVPGGRMRARPVTFDPETKELSLRDGFERRVRWSELDLGALGLFEDRMPHASAGLLDEIRTLCQEVNNFGLQS